MSVVISKLQTYNLYINKNPSKFGRFCSKGVNMLARMQSFAHAILKRDKESATQFDTEPTRWSWAKRIGAYEEVPATYTSFFQPLLESRQTFPYTILTPSFNRFMFKSNEKLVCDLGDELVILEWIGNVFEVQHHPIDKISYVEVRTILLDSQIKFCGLNKNGTNISSTLKFNSVTDYFFEPILKKIRLAHADVQKIGQTSESGEFDSLMDVNFKFMNWCKAQSTGWRKGNSIHFSARNSGQENKVAWNHVL